MAEAGADRTGESANPDVGSVFGFSLTVFLVGGIFFAAAANASRSKSAAALAVFTAIVLALALAVRLWGRLGLSRLEVDLSVDRDRLFSGDTLELRAGIANRKALPVWTRLELARPDALTPTGGDAVEGEAALLPFERITGLWPFRAERRGVFRLGPAALVAGDLLGLARRDRLIPFSREIVVFPRVLPMPEIDTPFRDYFGIHPSKGVIEDPAWYEGTREYSGNRPARNIHWKASARLDILQEKIFQPTSHRKVFFLLDGAGFAAENDEEGFENALEVIATLASRFAETGASFAAAVDRAVAGYPAALPLGRGPEHLGDVLELLARCGMADGLPLPSLVAAVGASGAGFVVVSKRPEEGEKRLAVLPASRRDRVLLLYQEDSVRS